MRVLKRLPKPVDEFEDLELALFPLRPLNLGVLLLFCFLYGLVVTTFSLHIIIGLARGIPLLYLSTVLYFQYMFLIIEYTSLGYQRIPKISGEMILPTHDHRLLKQAALISLIAGGYFRMPDPTWEFIYVCIVTVATPLATAVISNERKFYRALNPLLWARRLIAIGPGRQLLIYFAIQLGTMWVCYDSITRYEEIAFGDRLARVALLLLLSMWMFRGLGIMIHDSADALGLSVLFSERLVEEAKEASATEQLDALMAQLHDLSRADRFQEAWDLVKAKLTSEYRDQEEMFYRRLQALANPQLACRLGLDRIEVRIAAGDAEAAWHIYEWGAARWRGDYRPTTGRSVLRLAESANSRERYRLIAPQLERFEQSFPNHPDKGRALLLAACINVEGLEEFERGRELLDETARRYPELRDDQLYGKVDRILQQT